MPGNSQCMRFIAFGDSGSGLPAQAAIARELIRYREKFPFEFALMLGDNIYPNGNAYRYGVAHFTRLYKPLLDLGVRFYPVLGNHDVSGPMGVGWPTLGLSNQRRGLRFFGMTAPYYDFVCGDIHFFALNTNRFRSTQAAWLEDKLSKSASRWRIVYGHHPVLSSGWHGSTRQLQEKLQPILETCRAPLYLAGHEHDYERFTPVQGVTYIVSGGGGADIREFRTVLPGSLVRESRHHFMSFSQQGDTLHFEAIDGDSRVIDAGELHLSPAAISHRP